MDSRAKVGYTEAEYKLESKFIRGFLQKLFQTQILLSWKKRFKKIGYLLDFEHFAKCMTPELLKNIILDQQENDNSLPSDFPRAEEEKIKQFAKNKEIIILTGIRRCGKSVL